MPYSRQWREVNRLPTLEHEEFFELLMISPSYQLATAIKKGAIKMPPLNKRPTDFDKVLKIYGLVGDISEILFDHWWQTTGQHLFFDSHKSEVINVVIDLTRDKKDLLNEINKLIDSQKQKPETSTKIPFIKNKVRYKTLSSRVNLVHDFAAKRTLRSNFEYWRLAVFTGLKSQYIEGLKVDSKKTADNIVAREKLTELVSKHLKEALYFSENAARGHFPSNASIETGLDFDFELIKEVGSRQAKKESNYMYEQRKIGQQRLNDSQRMRLKKRNKKLK